MVNSKGVEKMRHAVILLAMLVALIPSSVCADELWILNEGGLEVTVDGTVTGVQYDGLSAFNPATGQVCAADIESGWVVITGDIQGYGITLACGQGFEDVIPEVRLVKDALPVTVEPIVVVEPKPVAEVNDNGPNNDGPSIAEMNAEKAIEEYNEWFITVSWNELD